AEREQAKRQQDQRKHREQVRSYPCTRAHRRYSASHGGLVMPGAHRRIEQEHEPRQAECYGPNPSEAAQVHAVIRTPHRAGHSCPPQRTRSPSQMTIRYVSSGHKTQRFVFLLFLGTVVARREPDPTRRNARAHTAILEATRTLIGNVGYDRMSIEGIAAAAGVGKQTIYRWWPSKAAVVLDAWAPEVQQHLIFPNTGDLAADLKTELKSASDLSNDPNFGPSFRALVAESQHDQTLATQLLERIFWPRVAAAKDRLRAAQADGQL